jgi:hypothetical protein
MVAEPFAEKLDPYVIEPHDYAGVPGASEITRGGNFAIAPFSFDGGRMGFLVAGIHAGASFDEVRMKTLAGLADQAKLAVSAVH